MIASRFKQTGQTVPWLDQEQEEVTKSMCGHVHADVKFVCAGVCVCVKVYGTGMPGTSREQECQSWGADRELLQRAGWAWRTKPVYDVSVCVPVGYSA